MALGLNGDKCNDTIKTNLLLLFYLIYRLEIIKNNLQQYEIQKDIYVET